MVATGESLDFTPRFVGCYGQGSEEGRQCARRSNVLRKVSNMNQGGLRGANQQDIQYHRTKQ